MTNVSARSVRPRHSEDGTSLLLILIFLTSIGVLSAALVSYEMTLNKQSFSVRRVQTRETGTNTGVEWAVNALRQGKDGFCQGGYTRELIPVGNRQVEVQCRPASDADAGTSGMALFLNQTEPADQNVVRTSGLVGANDVKNIVGPVYNGNIKDGWQLDAPLNVDGDVMVPDEKGGCEPGTTTDLPKNLTSLYRNMKTCTMDIGMVRPATVPLPCEVREKCSDPTPVSLDFKGGTTDGAAACKVFSPGYYSKPPVLAENNYFLPGVYDFETKTTWTIGSALRGGDPAPATDVAQEASLLSSIPKCVGAPEPAAPYGVVFVLGANASITVLPTARVELFSYTTLGDAAVAPGVKTDVAAPAELAVAEPAKEIAADVPVPTGQAHLPNIVAGGEKAVTEWAARSELPLSSDLLNVRTGEPELALHGGIYAPTAGVALRGRGAAVVTIRDTVVVGRFEMAVESELKRPDFGIFGRTGTVRKYLLMARSCPGTAQHIQPDACTAPQAGPLEQELCTLATATVYDDDKRTVYLDNWRVDRDPSAADPAKCELPK